MIYERCRRFDFGVSEHTFQFQSIHCRLPLVMVVGDHKSLIGPLCNVSNFVLPCLKLFGLVKVVIAIIAVVRLEPFFVIPPVQPNIADRRSNVLGPPNRFPKSRLVDVTEAHTFARKSAQDVWIVPAFVPDFQNQWIRFEFLDEIKKV
jgi:hypothetical protein